MSSESDLEEFYAVMQHSYQGTCLDSKLPLLSQLSGKLTRGIKSPALRTPS